MIAGGNWGNGNYAGCFSTNAANSSLTSDTLGIKIAIAPTDLEKTKVRPVDANALITELVEIMGGDYDDDTIRECIKIIKKSPTVKKRFGKYVVQKQKAER